MRRKRKYTEADALAAIVAGRRPLAQLIAACQNNAADPKQAVVGRMLRHEVWPAFEDMLARGRIDVPKARRVLAIIRAIGEELEAA